MFFFFFWIIYSVFIEVSNYYVNFIFIRIFETLSRICFIVHECYIPSYLVYPISRWKREKKKGKIKTISSVCPITYQLIKIVPFDLVWMEIQFSPEKVDFVARDSNWHWRKIVDASESFRQWENVVSCKCGGHFGNVIDVSFALIVMEWYIHSLLFVRWNDDNVRRQCVRQTCKPDLSFSISLVSGQWIPVYVTEQIT